MLVLIKSERKNLLNEKYENGIKECQAMKNMANLSKEFYKKFFFPSKTGGQKF